MTWIQPKYSRSRVSRAGDVLREKGPVDVFLFTEALEILSNWRASHAFPLNTIQTFLRTKAKIIDRNALVAQRLKRTPSIINKLYRFPTMQLDRMQDIGGCRAVVASGWHVKRLSNSIVRSSTRHRLINEKDYINSPKQDGYRGIHLIYKYQGTKTHVYNNLLIEIQLRTRMQHAWATAVEIMGVFLKQSLKSSRGPKEWLDYFSLLSISFAETEGCSPNDKTRNELRDIRRKVKRETTRLGVINRLNSFSVTANHLEQSVSRSDYYLLNFRPDKGHIEIFRYKRDELADATNHYLELEKGISEIPEADVVLVAAESIEGIRIAYPNYFADSREFIRYLNSL